MSEKKNKTAIMIIAGGIVVAVLVVGFFIWLHGGGNHSQKSSVEDGQSKVAAPAEEKGEAAAVPTPAEIVGKETPDARKKSLGLGATPQEEVKIRLPQSEEEIKNPPQWTRPIEVPDKPLEPPDPDVEPPMKVDPRRKPVDAAE